MLFLSNRIIYSSCHPLLLGLISLRISWDDPVKKMLVKSIDKEDENEKLQRNIHDLNGTIEDLKRKSEILESTLQDTNEQYTEMLSGQATEIAKKDQYIQDIEKTNDELFDELNKTKLYIDSLEDDNDTL